MANIPDVNFNKIPNKSAKFNQAEYYESNFDKINTQLIPEVNAQLADITSTLTLENQEWSVV